MVLRIGRFRYLKQCVTISNDANRNMLIDSTTLCVLGINMCVLIKGDTKIPAIIKCSTLKQAKVLQHAHGGWVVTTTTNHIWLSMGHTPTDIFASYPTASAGIFSRYIRKTTNNVK
jgi:hypothetical protein